MHIYKYMLIIYRYYIVKCKTLVGSIIFITLFMSSGAILQTTTCSGGKGGSAGGSCGPTLCVSDLADHCVPDLDLS